MAGHLFITRGNLLHLHCDAILIPSGFHPRTGAPGHLVEPWLSMGLDIDRDDCLVKPPDERRRAVAVRPATKFQPAVWAAHSGDAGRDDIWYAEPFRQFIRAFRNRKRSPVARPLSESRFLLAVPFLGTGAGGMADAKGDVMKSTIEVLLAELDKADLDVVFVLLTDASYSAAQEERSRHQTRWPELSNSQHESAEELATTANARRLVMFFGAGVSMGAGLPSWKDLLARLAEHADLSAVEQAQLDKLDPRDAGAVLTKRLGKEELRAAISQQVETSHVSLLHQLLASLPVTEALTTNYDVMFEQAWHDAGRNPTVLPKQHQLSSPELLVKLHGSVDDQRRPLVLSRDDYLRFETSGSALAGIVHAMLLTRHLLFVGYSLSDDNFHRIVHQVHETIAATKDRRGPDSRLGTVLTDQQPSLIETLWEGDLKFVSTNDTSGGGVRRVAIFLDRLASLTAARAEHLMDPSFDGVFSEDELFLRGKLLEVQAAANRPKVRPGVRQAVETALAKFGA